MGDNSYGALAEFGSTYNRDSSDDSWENTREAVEESRQKRSWTTKSRLATGALAVLCIVVVSLFVAMKASPSAASLVQNLASTFGKPSGASGDSSLPTDISVGQDVNADVTVGQDVIAMSDDISFTVTRDGYDPLIYFTPLDLSIMQYAILEPYVGVIEPSSDMTIEVFGTADDKYYSFDVCSTSDTSNCQTGYIYTTGNKEKYVFSPLSSPPPSPPTPHEA
jgi:hypothetical protein